jgi:hypothetical protein
MDLIENSVSNSSSVVVFGFVAVGPCLGAKGLLINGSCIFAYLSVFARKRVYMLQYVADCY